MATFVMLGKYSSESVRGISADRTKKAEELIAGLGGKVNSVCAMLGPYDLLLITEELFQRLQKRGWVLIRNQTATDLGGGR